MSVIRLALDSSDPQVRARLEALFGASWRLKRALQHDAADRVAAYWAGEHRRAQDPGGWRKELGLSRAGLEAAARAHLDRSGHLLHHLTKALALHQADEVWNGVARHLFPDAAGRYAGAPKIGRYHRYTRIPGRARSHTAGRKWETFRLHGSLAGHLAAYRALGLPAGLGMADAGLLPTGMPVLAQPRRMPPPRQAPPGHPGRPTAKTP
ncbi:hypothetical protein OG589_08835 [Sphaerisporangium sp. NBC_01403]|uniref:hypothetical protein n=1 Tax=Sphaerisporangium sp. NBC_01403 TaxID=2903599 RepID=UPI0032538461